MNRRDACIAKQAVGARRAAPSRLLILLILLSACAFTHAPTPRVALFAPFEGRYREVGYDALYAARLALADTNGGSDAPAVDLLAVDDGGTQAASHAAALAADPLVQAVVVLGYDGTAPETLAAFGDLPVLVVGSWGAASTSDSVFILANSGLDAELTAAPRISVTDAAALPAPVVGGEVFALTGFAQLRAALDSVTVISSGALPDAAFAERYTGSDPFAPQPGLLATLSYDATRMATLAAQTGSRASARVWLGAAAYAGLNGTIRFADGYWADAPIHRYHYVGGSLTEDVVK